MLDLGQLEQRLNRDPALMEKFLQDPVDVLRREGLTLSFEQQLALKAAITRARARPGGTGSRALGSLGFKVEPMLKW